MDQWSDEKISVHCHCTVTHRIYTSAFIKKKKPGCF